MPKPTLTPDAPSAPEPTLTTSAPSPEKPSPEGDGRAALDAKLAEVLKKHEPPPEPEPEPEPETGSKPVEETEPDEDSVAKAEPEDSAEAQASPTDGADEQAVPFHEHPRWKELQTQHKEALTRLQAAETQLKSEQDFREQHGITEEQWQAGLGMMATLNSDPAKFLSQIQPYLEYAAKVTGNLLPEDLAKRVEEGLDSKETAQALAKARAELERVKSASQHYQASQAQRLQSEIATAVQTWEDGQRKLDPDYTAKFDMIEGRFLALQRAKPPRNPQEAVALAQRAYDDTIAWLRRASPKPASAKPLDARSSPTKLAPPKTVQEAVARAMAKYKV